MCCPRSIQATHACHNKVSNIFFGLWSPKPFVVASIGVGPVFPCNKNHRSNEQLSRLATVSWKRAASLSVADVHKMWCTAEKIFMRHVNLSKESILAKFAAFFFAKTFHSLEDQTVGKGEILSWKSQSSSCIVRVDAWVVNQWMIQTMILHRKYSGPKICCPPSIQATHACHSEVSTRFFALWSPKPFVSIFRCRPKFPCNKSHESMKNRRD